MESQETETDWMAVLGDSRGLRSKRRGGPASTSCSTASVEQQPPPMPVIPPWLDSSQDARTHSAQTNGGSAHLHLSGSTDPWAHPSNDPWASAAGHCAAKGDVHLSDLPVSAPAPEPAPAPASGNAPQPDSTQDWLAALGDGRRLRSRSSGARSKMVPQKAEQRGLEETRPAWIARRSKMSEDSQSRHLLGQLPQTSATSSSEMPPSDPNNRAPAVNETSVTDMRRDDPAPRVSPPPGTPPCNLTNPPGLQPMMPPMSAHHHLLHQIQQHVIAHGGIPGSMSNMQSLQAATAVMHNALRPGMSPPNMQPGMMQSPAGVHQQTMCRDHWNTRPPNTLSNHTFSLGSAAAAPFTPPNGPIPSIRSQPSQPKAPPPKLASAAVPLATQDGAVPSACTQPAQPKEPPPKDKSTGMMVVATRQVMNLPEGYLSLEPGEKLMISTVENKGYYGGFKVADQRIRGWFPVDAVEACREEHQLQSTIVTPAKPPPPTPQETRNCIVIQDSAMPAALRTPVAMTATTASENRAKPSAPQLRPTATEEQQKQQLQSQSKPQVEPQPQKEQQEGCLQEGQVINDIFARQEAKNKLMAEILAEKNALHPSASSCVQPQLQAPSAPEHTAPKETPPSPLPNSHSPPLPPQQASPLTADRQQESQPGVDQTRNGLVAALKSTLCGQHGEQQSAQLDQERPLQIQFEQQQQQLQQQAQQEQRRLEVEHEQQWRQLQQQQQPPLQSPQFESLQAASTMASPAEVKLMPPEADAAGFALRNPSPTVMHYQTQNDMPGLHQHQHQHHHSITAHPQQQQQQHLNIAYTQQQQQACGAYLQQQQQVNAAYPQQQVNAAYPQPQQASLAYPQQANVAYSQQQQQANATYQQHQANAAYPQQQQANAAYPLFHQAVLPAQHPPHWETAGMAGSPHLAGMQPLATANTPPWGSSQYPSTGTSGHLQQWQGSSCSGAMTVNAPSWGASQYPANGTYNTLQQWQGSNCTGAMTAPSPPHTLAPHLQTQPQWPGGAAGRLW